MILPLKWDFMYVPNLPPHMLEAISESFMPILVGIHKKYLNHVNFSDKVVVHLDSNTV